MKFKWISLVSIPAIAAGVIPALTLSSCSVEKEKVIVDTDVGNDCDDIAALTVLGNVYRENRIEVKAVTNCNRSMHSVHAIDIILERYGIDCPIGRSVNDQPIHAEDYAREIDNRWIARSEIEPQRVQSATKLLRKTLAENKGKKIKLITLGMFNNIYNLLQSGPDEISSKTGKQLFDENISEMVSMGGNFHNQQSAEFNITEALDAAREVINNTSVPITFLDWQVGEVVKSGKTFYESPGSPQCVAYSTYTHGELRQSWDPLTMYVALNGGWEYSPMGDVNVDEQGHTIFTESKSGKCRYVEVHPDSDEISAKLETWYKVR